MRKLHCKKYYSKKYNIITKDVVVPRLDGTIGFMGEDGKQYCTMEEDLVPIKAETEESM